jgi:hypothetical protein
MTLILQVLHFANIFAAALVAGGLVFVLMVIVPAKRALPPRPSVEVHLAMLCGQPDRYMKPLGIISGLLAIVLVVLLREATPVKVAPLLVGLVGSLGVFITSHFFNVQTNRQIESWSLDALPANYPEVRNRWDRVHAIRTAAGLLALAGYITSCTL